MGIDTSFPSQFISNHLFHNHEVLKMAITQEFSLQNTTVEIFDNSTGSQQSAMTTLRAAIRAASNDAGRVTAYDVFLTQSTTTGSLTVVGTGFTTSSVDGSLQGTWTQTSSGATGTWSANNVSSATAAVATITGITSGTPTSVTAATTGFTYTITTGTGAVTAASTAITITTGTGAGAKIGKITAIGDTGKTFATISAKLVSESGTIKAKGSSDEGDLTLDYISIPSDSGQMLMESAFDDESINGNRVFRLTHSTSGAKLYAIGMVTELKKTRGAVDNFASVKAKITLQDGLAEYNPA